jgi:hypothetical protein
MPEITYTCPHCKTVTRWRPGLVECPACRTPIPEPPPPVFKPQQEQRS